MTADAPLVFTCRGARSAGVTGLIGGLIVIETAVLHLLLVHLLPALAYLLTLSSLLLLVWLIRDFHALGVRPALTIDGDSARVTVGQRVRGEFLLAAVDAAFRPTWKDLGASAPRYLNGTKPAAPNVLIVFTSAQHLTLVGAIRRPVMRLALHLDEPEHCVAALTRAAA